MAIKRQGGRSKAVNRAKRGRKDDGLATTPTQYGERSPDYKKQAGDPDYLRSFSEEQIGLLGGRAAIFERVASKQDPSNFSDPSDTISNQESTLTVDDPISMSEGPTTPPTTYGTDPFSSGKKDKTPTPQKPKKVGSPVKKGNMLGRIAKTTGTTRGEARGIMKGVRKQVRRGNVQGARRKLTRSLSGGPRGGVPGSKSRTTKARATSRKVVSRIQERQRSRPTPTRRTVKGTTVKRRKK